MKVRYRGSLYNSIVEAAASRGANPVDLHLEMIQVAKTGERFYTDEGDGYMKDTDIETEKKRS